MNTADTEQTPLKMAYKNSYAKINASETHANGWVIVMFKNDAWQPLDRKTLYNFSGSAPDMARVYFNANTSLTFKEATVISDTDQPALFELEPVANPLLKNEIIEASIEIYELQAVGIGRAKVGTDEKSQQAIKQCVIDVVTDHLINTEYTIPDVLEVIAIPTKTNEEV